jgi:hypothetical protein
MVWDRVRHGRYGMVWDKAYGIGYEGARETSEWERKETKKKKKEEEEEKEKEKKKMMMMKQKKSRVRTAKGKEVVEEQER